MSDSKKASLNLSQEMTDLKEDIIQAKVQKDKDLLEEIHEKSSIVATISSGIANTFGVAAAVPTAFAELPIIGFALKMFSVVPAAITTLTDPKKSWAEKGIAMSILLSVIALSIAGVAVVATAAGASLAVMKAAAINAAIIGTSVSAFMVSLELFKLTMLSLAKHHARKALSDKKEFNEALQNEVMPEGDKFDVAMEVRAVELERKKSQSTLTDIEQKQLEFVLAELLKRKLTIATDPDGPAKKLGDLYVQRDEKLLALATLITKIDTKTQGADNTATLDDMTAVQEEILALDNDIDSITQPIEKLKLYNLVLDENIAQTVTTASMSLVGLMLSVTGLLLAIGTIAAPPFIGPVLIGFGIGMAVMSLVTWAAFKWSEHTDAKNNKIKEENQLDNVLDEALDYYEKNELISVNTAKSGSSYKTLMDSLATPSANNTPVTALESTVTPTPVKTVEQSAAPTQPLATTADKSVELPLGLAEEPSTRFGM